MQGLQRFLLVLPRRAAEKWLADDASVLAAAVAYYFAISLFPLLLVLVSAVGFVLQWTQFGQDAERQIIEAAASQVSPAVADQLAKLLATVRDQAPTGGPLGLVLLLATVTAMFVQFDAAFDVIWKVGSPTARGIVAAIKRIVFVRFKAFLMLVGVGLLVMVALVAGLVWNGVDAYAAGVTPFWGHISWWSRPLLNLLVNILAIALIYRYLPKTYVAWRNALAGAVVAAIGWEIGRQVLAAYVIGREYGSAYATMSQRCCSSGLNTRGRRGKGVKFPGKTESPVRPVTEDGQDCPSCSLLFLPWARG
jgi:membrane protein